MGFFDLFKKKKVEELPEAERAEATRKLLEKALVEELSELIDEARKTTDENIRKNLYSQALDIVMQLAIELPTYQRSDLFAYNTNIIDVDSLTPASELTPYNGPMSKIWEVSLKETGK